MRDSAFYALVTGASQGIGLAIARVLASEGRNLILVARREDVLTREAAQITTDFAVDVRVFPQDLGSPDSAASIETMVSNEALAVDYLVNNAGYGLVGAFTDRTRAEQLDMLAVNTTALTDLTHRFLHPMVARGHGTVLNVASVAAFEPGPYMAVYHATKAYVLFLTEALAEELSGTGVTVTVLCPGPVRTGFGRRSGGEDHAASKILEVDVDRVARVGVNAARQGRVIAIPGMMNRIATVLVQLGPRAFVRKAVGRIQRSRIRD